MSPCHLRQRHQQRDGHDENQRLEIRHRPHGAGLERVSDYTCCPGAALRRLVPLLTKLNYTGSGLAARKYLRREDVMDTPTAAPDEKTLALATQLNKETSNPLASSWKSVPTDSTLRLPG
jgi:hypothetical protein